MNMQDFIKKFQTDDDNTWTKSPSKFLFTMAQPETLWSINRIHILSQSTNIALEAHELFLLSLETDLVHKTISYISICSWSNF